MKRVFTERGLLKVYLDKGDLARLTNRANSENRAVSDYVRELVLEDLAAAEEMPVKNMPVVQEAKKIPNCAGSVERASVVPEIHTVCAEGHPLEPGRPGKCNKWGCRFYAYAR